MITIWRNQIIKLKCKSKIHEVILRPYLLVALELDEKNDGVDAVGVEAGYQT